VWLDTAFALGLLATVIASYSLRTRALTGISRDFNGTRRYRMGGLSPLPRWICQFLDFFKSRDSRATARVFWREPVSRTARHRTGYARPNGPVITLPFWIAFSVVFRRALQTMDASCCPASLAIVSIAGAIMIIAVVVPMLGWRSRPGIHRLLTAAAPDGGDEQRVAWISGPPRPQVSRSVGRHVGKESADARAGASDRCFRGVSDWFVPGLPQRAAIESEPASPQSDC